jgi:hypothetical protein
MDFYFAYELNQLYEYFLLRSRLGKVTFLNNFDSIEFLRILLAKFVASSKATLTEKVAFDILGNTIRHHALVLNYEQVLVGYVRGCSYDPAGST